jgi:hypothetical protein
MPSAASSQVPVSRDAITAKWLTHALRSTGAIAAESRVTACEQQPVVAFTLSGEAREDGGGLSGPQIVRLKLAYAGGAGPEQMVVKFGNWFDKQQMPAWPLKTRLIQAIGNLRLEDQFRSEIKFYRDIWPHINGVLLPKVYYAAIADIPNVKTWSYVLFDKRTRLRFCVLMEDLAGHQFTPVRPGEGLSFNRAKQALLNIAQLHAFGWNQPELWDRLQLRPTPWLTFLRADEGQQRKYRDKFVHTDFIPTFLKLWAQHPRQGDHAHGFAMLRDPEMAAMLSAFNASFSTWAAEAAKTPREAAQTIVHGDFHGWNHLFNPADECRVVDFQFLGRGRVADELAYFFMTSFDPEPAAEAGLLELYHHALVEAGVQGYAYERFLHEYYVSTLTLLLGSIVRAVKFLKPGQYDKLGLDQKQADLMQVGDLMRDRMMTRALDWYQTPPLRQRFFSRREMA